MVLPNVVLNFGSNGGEWLAGAIGVLGAVVGSVVAVVGTEIAGARNRRRDRTQRNAALSFAIYQKISFIYSDATIVRKALRAGILSKTLEDMAVEKRGLEISPDGKIVQRHISISSFVLGWANPPPSITFTTDETWVAKDVSGVELLNSMMSLDRTFNALILSVQRYTEERQELQKDIRVDEVSGIVVSMSGTPEEFRSYKARSNSLDDMILTMHEMAEELVVDAFKALRLLVESPLRPFGNGSFETVTPDGDAITLQAEAVQAVVQRMAAYR